MDKIHIVGRRNNGKTTLLTELVQAFSKQGVRVGTIKHSSHNHELDTPGKDSYRHRQAGATPSAIITPEMLGVYLPFPPQSTKDPYQLLTPLFQECDLVLVEGNIETDSPKVEVWREDLKQPPLATKRSDISALITESDFEGELSVPVWSRKDLTGICSHLLALARNQ